MLCKEAAKANKKKKNYTTSLSEQTWTLSHPSKSNARQVVLSIFMVSWLIGPLGKTSSHQKTSLWQQLSQSLGETLCPHRESPLSARHQPHLQTHHPKEISEAALWALVGMEMSKASGLYCWRAVLSQVMGEPLHGTHSKSRSTCISTEKSHKV